MEYRSSGIVALSILSTQAYIRGDAAGIRNKEIGATAVRRAFETLGGRAGYTFRHVNLVSGEIPVARLEALAKSPGVLQIVKDQVWSMDITLKDKKFTDMTKAERKAFI